MKCINVNAFKNANCEEFVEEYLEEEPCSYDNDKIRDILSKEKIQEKIVYFMNKNMKIHQRKMKNFGQNNS